MTLLASLYMDLCKKYTGESQVPRVRCSWSDLSLSIVAVGVVIGVGMVAADTGGDEGEVEGGGRWE